MDTVFFLYSSGIVAGVIPGPSCGFGSRKGRGPAGGGEDRRKDSV